MARKKSDTLQGDALPEAASETAGEPGALAEEPVAPAPDEAVTSEAELTSEAASEPEVATVTEPVAETVASPDVEPWSRGIGSDEPTRSGDDVEPVLDAGTPIAEPEPAAAIDTAAEREEAARDVAREPVPVVDSVEEHPEETHEEEAGWSLASRLLLALCLLIAGAGLGIWAAPKIAPVLPSGMAPVARWLEPGQAEADARLAELQAKVDSLSEIEGRIAALPTADDVAARIDAAVAAAEAKLSAEIASASESLGQVDLTSVNQRLGQLEAGVQGSTTELETLKAQIAGTAGQLSQDALGRVDAYKGEVEALRGEMGSVRDAVSGFATRLDAVEARADREVEAAQAKVAEIQAKAETQLSASAAATDIAQIRAAISGGESFEQPLAALAGQGTAALPEGLSDAAASGVATLASLRESYPDAAHAAIRASIMAGAGDGVLARSRAFVEAQVSSRSLTPQAGEGSDAVLSRMEDKLRQDDLDGVLAEAEQLPSEAAAAMGDWLAAVKKRAAAIDGLATLDSSLDKTN